MNRPHYLMIVEKPYMVRMFEKVLTKMENENPLNFDVDIVPANNHIINTDALACVAISEQCNMQPLKIKNRVVPKNYQLVTSDFMDGITSMVKMMIDNNNYDAIVNACAPHVEGDLKFQYMIGSLGLNHHMMRHICVGYFTEDEIARELRTLNN